MKLIIAFIIGFCLASGIVYGYRIPKPNRITDFDQKGLVVINDNFEKLFDITNGRYSLNIVTVNPDGATRGDTGDMLLLNVGGTYYLEICVGGTVWRGEELSNTP